MSQKCVAIAMSGGVDSSVAAAILKKRRYRIFGITMLLCPKQIDSASENAKKVADILNIPHYVVDLRKLFKKKVIDHFCNEYQQGRTPNPCINCNNHIKFSALMHKTKELGADYMATGHYAQVKVTTDGYQLLRGVDHNKDQSYFLYSLKQSQIQHLLLPIGSLFKSQAKRIAGELGLTDSIKTESQDICFITNSNYSAFIGEYATSLTGDIIDVDGQILGRHRGFANYTIGQRQGLGLISNKRLYVIRFDTSNNQLVVGTQEYLMANNLSANQLSWVSGKVPGETNCITAKIRYRSPEIATSLSIKNDVAKVRFAHPQRAIAPGQSIVFYQGQVVLGGGIIETPKLE